MQLFSDVGIVGVFINNKPPKLVRNLVFGICRGPRES